MGEKRRQPTTQTYVRHFAIAAHDEWALSVLSDCLPEKCMDGIQALRHYPYEVDELGGLRLEPLHDQHSHAADAFRTAAVMIREPERKKEQGKRRPAGKLSPWS
jgi:hypothetical protein